MNKFDNLYKKIIFEDVGKNPDVDTVLPEELCNPNNCYLWVKGKANVYGCMVTEENFEAACKFLQHCKENPNLKAKLGQYLVYNPHISEAGGQVWMNKLQGYVKATSENTNFDSLHLSKDDLEFDEYVFIPKEKIEEMNDETDKWIGFQIPEGMTFKIEDGCGRNGSDGSTADGTQWLPIKDGQFDWARSLDSMKQSNFECKGKTSATLSEKCKESWENAFKESKATQKDEIH